LDLFSQGCVNTLCASCTVRLTVCVCGGFPERTSQYSELEFGTFNCRIF